MTSSYTGDRYVGWTCLDGYSKYTIRASFSSLFSGVGIYWLGNSYQEILTVAPNKPIMIGEVATIEAGDGGAKKAAWIKDALLTGLPRALHLLQGSDRAITPPTTSLTIMPTRYNLYLSLVLPTSCTEIVADDIL